MSGTPPARRAPLIDLLKVVSIQLIVWHHLAFYGPMSDVVHPWAPALWDWLYDRGRLAVQVFLVVGGFLAAQSLQRRLHGEAGGMTAGAWGRQVWRRYLRLGKPYWVALGLAVLSAALARGLMDHPATPSAPTWFQVGAHLLMLHDVLGQESLSAGVWYVAIDLQLFALLAALGTVAAALARRTRRSTHGLWRLGCAGLTALSLWGFNLDARLDGCGLYFFGTYGLGVLAHAAARGRRPALGIVGLGLLVGVALVVGWRDRVVVAAITSLVLVRWGGTAISTSRHRALLAHLADRSYALFLVHYPVCLAVNAMVHRAWPDDAAFNAAGLLVAWAASLAAAEGLYRLTEAPQAALRWEGLRASFRAMLLSLAIAQRSAVPAAPRRPGLRPRSPWVWPVWRRG